MPYLLKLFNCQDTQGMGVFFVCFLKLDMVIFILEKKKKTVLQSIFVSVALILIFFSLGDGCSFPTCLVNQDPEQASTPGGLNSTSKK